MRRKFLGALLGLFAVKKAFSVQTWRGNLPSCPVCHTQIYQDHPNWVLAIGVPDPNDPAAPASVQTAPNIKVCMCYNCGNLFIVNP